jgi:hypothetical protein
LYEFAKSVLWQLSHILDRRLVQTFFDLLMVIIIQRHRNQGLLLSELGGQLLGMGCAPAGTKRIAQLIHSPKWLAQLLEDWMWAQGDQKVEDCLHPQLSASPR